MGKLQIWERIVYQELLLPAISVNFIVLQKSVNVPLYLYTTVQGC